MSQVKTITKNGNELYYGLDRVLGYFITEYDKRDEELVFEGDTYGICGVKLNQYEIVGEVSKRVYDTNAHEKYFNRILMDLDVYQEGDTEFDDTGRVIV